MLSSCLGFVNRKYLLILIALETDDTKLVSSVYKSAESDATKKEIAEENSSG